MRGKGKTASTSELAALLGISRQRVNELGRAGKITREADGNWNPDRVARDLGRNLDGAQKSPARERATPPEHGVGQRREEAPREHPPKGTLAYEQWRLTREKADREALDRKVLEGELLKRAEVKTAVSAMLGAFKARCMTIADELCDKLAATSDSVRCRELVDSKIHAALSELSEWRASAA